MKKILSALAAAAMLVVMTSFGSKTEIATEGEGGVYSYAATKSPVDKVISLTDEAARKIGNARTVEEAEKIANEMQARIGEIFEAYEDYEPTEEEAARLRAAEKKFKEAMRKARNNTKSPATKRH